MIALSVSIPPLLIQLASHPPSELLIMGPKWSAQRLEGEFASFPEFFSKLKRKLFPPKLYLLFLRS